MSTGVSILIARCVVLENDLAAALRRAEQAERERDALLGRLETIAAFEKLRNAVGEEEKVERLNEVTRLTADLAAARRERDALRKELLILADFADWLAESQVNYVVKLKARRYIAAARAALEKANG